MRRFIRQFENKMGFTIVELLTVMSIIIILIGLLVPALNMANRYAREVRQRAQFHGIDAALELFKNEFEDYPDSYTPGKTPDLDEGDEHYPGAARLCEAMVGQDLLGFYPDSHFRADLTIDGTTATKIYDNPPTDPLSLYPNPTDNLQARQKPYLPLEKVNAYKFEDIYGTIGIGDTQPDLYVLCDEYARVKHKTTGKRIGMPILYYKANTAGTKHDPCDLPPSTSGIQFYDYRDNDYLVGSGMPWNTSAVHPMYTEPGRFYESTKNPKILLIDGRPYRADSYILISAGFDGQYGTPDDIFNFEP